jgi:hypothetical protein
VRRHAKICGPYACCICAQRDKTHRPHAYGINTSPVQKRKGNLIDPDKPIDPASMTLGDLIWHAHSNANLAEQRYQEEHAKKKQAAEKPQEVQPEARADAAATEQPQNAFAPQLVLRDGKIVLDEGSLTVQVCATAAPGILCLHCAYSCVGLLLSSLFSNGDGL